MNDQIRRKNYFIDKRFQARFIFYFLLITFVSLVLTLALIFFFSRDSYTVAIENTQVIVKTTADFIFPITLQTVLIVLALSSVWVVLLTLIFSHRISGPLYRLIQEVRLLERGDLTRTFQTRGKDQMKVFSESLSHMASALKNNYADLKHQHLLLKKLLEDKNFIFTDPDKKYAADLLRTIEERLNQFKTS